MARQATARFTGGLSGWIRSALPGVVIDAPDEERGRRDRVVDATMYVVAFAIGAATLADTWELHPPWLRVVAIVVGIAALVSLRWRRSHPAAVGVGVAAVSIVIITASGANLVALFNAAIRARGRDLAVVAGLTIAWCFTNPLLYTGGAPTLAFGMSEVLSKVFGGDALKAFWYHFAIMFEALFILTTVDAGTRVARFMLSDGLSNLGGPFRKLRDPSWRVGAWACSLIVVAAWGSVLLMGVTDPLGGINSLFPLFGIANQLLAAIALTVVSVVVIKKGYLKWVWIPGVPLLWDLAVTLTASWQKIFSGDPKVGFWKQHSICDAAQEAGKLCLTAKTPGDVDKIVRNTFIQGSLSILFASLVVIVFATGLIMALRAIRGGGTPSTEDEPVPSRIFAPSGLIPTRVEREVQKQWDALPKSHARSVGTGAH